jgi:fibronectin-binding autotransporter adhesin
MPAFQIRILTSRWPRACSRRTSYRPRKRCWPQLAALESRALLSTFTVTNDADSGSGSLRAALGSAVAGETIKFAASAYGTIMLSSGPLEITSSVAIEGPGASKVAINGSNAHQDLVAEAGVTATISGLTITGGEASDTYLYYDGGGVYNKGTLTINNCVISGNAAQVGGGIANDGSLTINNCSVSDNTGDYGAGISNNAGAVMNISNSTISNNSANLSYGFAGGINNLATATITGSLVSSNSASIGGGIYSGDVFGPAALTITNSVVRDNSGPDDGGGIDIQSLSSTVSSTEATIAGSTFANNTTGSGSLGTGGAICTAGEVSLAISGSLFQSNAALASSEFGNTQGGAIFMYDISYPGYGPAPTLSVANSSFVTNSAAGAQPDGGAIYVGYGTNAEVTGTSFDGNVVTAGAYSNAQAGAMDLENSPLQSALTDDTFQGNVAMIPAGVPGAASATGGALIAGTTTTITGCSFIANRAVGGLGGGFGIGGAVELQGFRMFELSNDQFTGNAAIGGAGDGQGSTGGTGLGGALNVFSGTVTVSDSTFVGNQAEGGTEVPATYTFGQGGGGAIFNEGTLTVSGCTLSANSAIGGAGTDGAAGSAGIGGAILTFSVLAVTDSAITGNAAVGGAGGGSGDGGGIFNDATSDAPGLEPLTVTNSTIALNAAIGGSGGGNGDGGGIYNIGTASLTNTYVAFNEAIGGSGGGQGVGGGLYVGGGSMTLLGTTEVVFNFASTSNSNIYGPYST